MTVLGSGTGWHGSHATLALRFAWLRALSLIIFVSGQQFDSPLSWDLAFEKADALVMQMTSEEKYSLMHGIGWWWIPIIRMGPVKKWWYTGNIPAIPRLGVPSLSMNDAGGGFRDHWTANAGSSTCWPSLLALASTWNTGTVRDYAEALGDEFSAKGANMILGPSIDMHRVARGGRNFESLCGEDPYLGARLTEVYVQGVQSRKVAAVMKHWVFNNQETHRGSYSSIVDDKTANEMYYPPFRAAIDAGVSAAMCSYNQVDGVHSCSNERYMKVLKEELGFRGFVMSDWWATHTTSVEQGLDQELPGSDHFSPESLARVRPTLVNASARRILAAMYRLDLMNSTKCSPPHCKEWLRKNVSTEAHQKLARSIATESVVLLKNVDDVLPITSDKVKTIAVVGSPAVSKPRKNLFFFHVFPYGDYYSGGGSGHVTPAYVVTPLEGIKRRAAVAGIKVISSARNSIRGATAAASKADVTIVVAATTSGETRDRKSLNLDNGANALISAVAKKAKRTVVLMQVPGVVMMPWRDSVFGIATMFLGGQETGSAWASVIFGDHAPTGRLPIMFPAAESDTVSPSQDSHIIYSEGLHTSYRNTNLTAAFPFGHGLTYTTFKYGKASARKCAGATCVRLSIWNDGKLTGETTVQLYLEFPPVAGFLTPVLKGFQKTGAIRPGRSSKVTFRLHRNDVSYWDSAGTWVVAPTLVVHLGESSADLRQTIKLSFGGSVVFV